MKRLVAEILLIGFLPSLLAAGNIVVQAATFVPRARRGVLFNSSRLILANRHARQPFCFHFRNNEPYRPWEWRFQPLCNAAQGAGFRPIDPASCSQLEADLDVSPDPRLVRPGYEAQSIEGWTVFVSEALRKQDSAATDEALKLLREQLQIVVERVPSQAVASLRTVPLWFSPPYTDTRPTAEYHPDANWLRKHNRNPAMAKGVEFSNIATFDKAVRRMPVFVLHELAHAYHDQVLGFDQPEIKAAYQRAVASKSYDAIQRSNGKIERAYAMTNKQEYFAETSEAFFGENDFYPFSRAELQKHDPEMFRLLQRVWLAP